MDVRVLHLLAGARQASGVAVVIDVFRAFTHACCLLDRGAARLFVAEQVEEAMALRRRFPDAVLAGERDGRRVAGFDLGNSPSESLTADIAGRPVVLTTSAGTRGLFAAAGADEVLAASLVNAGATVDYLRAAAPEQISLVCMGEAGCARAAEDDACGEWIAAQLTAVRSQGQNGGDGDRTAGSFDLEARLAVVREAPSATKFGDPARPWFPAADLDCCLDPDRYPFALRLVMHPDGSAELVPTRPATTAATPAV